jgi:hypothetical protein
VFGPLDEERVRRGAELFQRQGCAGCHSKEGWHSLDTIGTDPNRLQNYNLPVNTGGGRTATYATNLHSFALAIKEKAYEIHRVPAETRAKMDEWQPNVKPRWITTLDKGYFTRPLRGVWASAPFLHNNSVPSLWDLLQPADQRPRSFAVGHRDFDPLKVGYIDSPEKVVWTFDTSIPGNLNSGHEFGTKLPESDKWALIEFLKTL